jgi:hypothetical protein
LPPGLGGKGCTATGLGTAGAGTTSAGGGTCDAASAAALGAVAARATPESDGRLEVGSDVISAVGRLEVPMIGAPDSGPQIESE